jgi:hypothetical protein
MTTYQYRGPEDADPHTVEATGCQPYESNPRVYVFVRPTKFDDTTYPESVVSMGVFAIEPPQELG